MDTQQTQNDNGKHVKERKHVKKIIKIKAKRRQNYEFKHQIKQK